MAIIVTGFQLYLELENREEDRVNRAWSLIAAVKEVQGNVGLIEALETLNARQIDMSRLKLPSAYLEGVRLEGAELSFADLNLADLSGANLSDANLSGANLSGVDLRGAMLTGANLSGADLTGATLSEANLTRASVSDASLFWANLSDANLSGANLAGADLRGAMLTGDDPSNRSSLQPSAQKQLNTACGDVETKLPLPSLTLPRCGPRLPP